MKKRFAGCLLLLCIVGLSGCAGKVSRPEITNQGASGNQAEVSVDYSKRVNTLNTGSEVFGLSFPNAENEIVIALKDSQVTANHVTGWQKRVVDIDLAVSPDGRYKARKSGQTISVVNDDEQRVVATFPVPILSHATSFSPDNRFFLYDTGQSSILIDLSTGRKVYEFDAGVGSMFSGDGRFIVTVRRGSMLTQDSIVKVYDLSNGQLVFEKNINAFVKDIEISRDGKIIALAVIDGWFNRPGSLIVLNGKTGAKLFEKKLVNEAANHCKVTISSDNKFVAVGTWRNFILYNTRTWMEKFSLENGTNFFELMFSPNSQLLAFSMSGLALVGGSTSGAFLLDVNSGQYVYESVKESSVNAMAFSADGLRFATGRQNGDVDITFLRRNL